MEPFTVLTSRAVPLDIANVDTDQLIPARFLKKPRSSGYDNYLLYDLRFDEAGAPRPDFVLNRPEYRGAKIVVTGPNFGCGSSREGAVYALVDAGIRCVIAASFGDIFFNNAPKNGLLPVVLPPDQVAEVRAALDGACAELTVDLQAQEVRGPGFAFRFDIDPFRREGLLKGIDEIDLTLQYRERIEAFRADYLAERPWAGVRG
ncbi:MAG TPA: 3-isopropylmalate dehydratase small subunit [Azospirillaceae bacterium]|nr:3-isopropylmalate dehydratase small subunit [Azospirillaceae bacterium]